ncbi:flippase [Winogradskyella wichelsiae]|uniref:flippase n=1 Tax=Winogradskyella wichelsiae TaxID=2697007 RepID=UPI0015C741AD|nr:flippase [Winogradskyella wichelsiae]
MNIKKIIKTVIDKTKGDFAKKSIISITLKLLGLFLSYLFTVLISRIFGAEITGRFSLAFTILNIFAIIFALGIPDAIVKLSSDSNYKESFNFKKISFRLILMSSILGAIILYGLAHPLTLFYKDSSLYDYFVIASMTICPLIILRYNYESLRGRNKIVKFAILANIVPYFIAILSIFLIQSLSSNLYGIISMEVYFIGTILACLLSFLMAKEPNQPKKEFLSLKRTLHYALPMLATSSFIFIMGWTDTLMLGYFNSTKDVGIYNVVIKIARIAIIMLTSINLVLAPRISELYSNSETEKLKGLIKGVNKIIFISTIPVVFVILVANKFILGLFGPEFIAGSTALVIIIISQCFNVMTGSVSQVLNMTGYHRNLRNFTIISAGLNLILNFILIPIYGIIGAAIATGVSSVLLNLMAVIFVKKRLGIITYFNPFSF